VKTTLELPDDLMREIKVRAAREDRKLKDLIADLLRRGLAAEPRQRSFRRVQFPVVECAHAAAPDQELTPERVAMLLADDEAESAANR